MCVFLASDITIMGGSIVKQQHDEHVTQSNVLTNITEALSDPLPVCIVRCPPFVRTSLLIQNQPAL